ncbi:NAD dependent epimerase/dehydratase family enzyme [Frigoribacterium sp. PvP054]|uniref:epimerase n=1 Tax=Frigoribacterium sp. PvP054 TaxID=3156438 RepID=UPI003393AD4F
MTDHIVLAGASGFIGQHLAEAFRAEGARVSLIGRHGPDASWGDTAGITALLEGADLLVNLAGKSVNCRYGPENRAEIMRSRVETTRELKEAVLACTAPPRVWMNSSTATIYRHAEDRPMTESTGEIGSGFSVDVATSWEAEFFSGELPSTRRVALRMAIVLGDGSALVPLMGLVRAGLGGPQLDGPWPATRARLAAGTYHREGRGGGRQKFSWIHVDDVLGAIRFARADDSLEGVLNLSSPNPSDNRGMMRTLRRVLGVPVGLPAWRWMLELGTAVLRTETELVLKSRWVLPERLVEGGYEFVHPHLDEALKSIVAGRRGAA